MRLKEFLLESKDGSFLVKNNLTYLPLAAWLESEIGNSPEELPDSEVQDDITTDNISEAVPSNPSKHEADDEFGLGINYDAISDQELADILTKYKYDNLVNAREPTPGMLKNKPKKAAATQAKYDYAQDELSKWEKHPEKRTKKEVTFDRLTRPHVHANDIVFIENGHEVDVEYIRKVLMTRPTVILAGNEKMQHSNGDQEKFHNIGLPALRGIAVNESSPNNEFVFVNTCPGAGKCKTYCFALKGSYIMFPTGWSAYGKRLNFLLNDPEGFAAQVNSEIKAKQAEYAQDNIRLNIRWHDAGDFFSPEYSALAMNIAKNNPKVRFFAYTKMAYVMLSERPKNFIMNWSEDATPEQREKVDAHFSQNPDKVKKGSHTLQKDLWNDLMHRVPKPDGKKGTILDWKSPAAFKELKQRMAEKYNIDPRSILKYDEMLEKKEGRKPKWNVIIRPGEGDTSAIRHDVIGTYLIIH